MIVGDRVEIEFGDGVIRRGTIIEVFDWTYGVAEQCCRVDFDCPSPEQHSWDSYSSRHIRVLDPVTLIGEIGERP